jgi:hypothetical protein
VVRQTLAIRIWGKVRSVGVEKKMPRLPNRIQVTLAGLLAAVGAIAFCLAALTHASPNWASVFLTGTVAVLFVALSRTIATRGRSRAFWAGFAVWGWGYLFLVSWPAGPYSWPEPWVPASMAEPLPTTRLLRWTHGAMPVGAGPLAAGTSVSIEESGRSYPGTILATKGEQYLARYDGWPSNFDTWVTSARLRPSVPKWESFQQIGQAAWALLLGLFGGFLTRYWWRSNEAANSKERPQ